MPSRKRPTTLKELFIKAADVIERYGWQKGGYGPVTLSGGPHCAEGALRAICHIDEGPRNWDLYSEAQDATYTHTGTNLVYWNDNVANNKEQVVALFRELAAAQV